MAAYREKIDSHFFRIDPKLSKCLNSVHMIQSLRTFFMDKGCNLLHRHYRAHLIIYIHGGNKNRILPKGCLKSIQSDYSLLIHRQNRHLKALLL